MLDEVRRSRGGSTGATALVARMVDNLRSGKSILEAVMNPQQQGYVAQMQALMSLVEGYSNHVMNAVGEKLMPHFDQIKGVLDSRQREQSNIERMFLKLTGLSMKMEQYRQGERFVNSVVKARGIQFAIVRGRDPRASRPWRKCFSPTRWIARMQRAS